MAAETLGSVNPAAAANAAPELVIPQVTGLLVPPRDPHTLLDAMRTLIDSAELRRRYGKAARARAAAMPRPPPARIHA